MRNTIRRCKYILICGFLAVVSLIYAAVNFIDIQKYQDIYYINNTDNGGISAEEAYLYQKYEADSEESKSYSILFWEYAGSQTISNTELASQTETRMFVMCGRSDLLIGDIFTMDYDDGTLCVLGRDDAYALFGSTDIKGLKVNYNGKQYEVAGVTDEMNSAFIIEGRGELRSCFNRMNIVPVDSEERMMIKQEIESVFSPGSYMENALISWILGMLLALIINVVIIYAAMTFIKIKRDRFVKIIIVISAVILCIASILILVNYPRDMIPSSWSDFGFWSEILDTKKENVMTFMESEKTEIELSYILSIIKTAAACCFAIFFFIVTVLLMKNVRRRDNDGSKM